MLDEILNTQNEPKSKVAFSIEALGPISLCTTGPGSVFHTSSKPSEKMIFGLLENALGLHFDDKCQVKKEILKLLKKKGKSTGSKYLPIIDKVVNIEDIQIINEGRKFFDYWKRHTKELTYQAAQLPQMGGYGKELIPLMQAIAAKTVTIGRGEESITDPKLIMEKLLVDKPFIVNPAVIKGKTGNFYAVPTLREYVLNAEYRVVLSTTHAMQKLISNALTDPAAPLYLGTSEGWVDCKEVAI